MVKRIALLFVISLLSFAKAQDIPDLLSIPGPIELDGTEFFLSWSKPMSKTLYRQQYLPADEQIEDFTQLLDFSYFTKEIEMELAVRQKVEAIQNREKTDKYAQVNVMESPDGKEYIVDYSISENPAKGNAFIEYNVYRFKTIGTENGKHFLILSYVKRMYGDVKSAAKSLKKQREHIISTIIDYKIPAITVKNQQ